MVVRFRKKVRRWRGCTTHGWGSKKKHRGGGSRGGRGMSGFHKHKYSYLTTYEPNMYKKKGFASIYKKDKIINVGDLEKLDAKDIDLTSLGYGKLLSRGSISKPLTVKVKSYSAGAKQKIEKAGGKIISK